MPNGSGPFLVQRHNDGYGDVFPLEEGQHVTLGRANTNLIVLKDELCSREHAEVYFADAHWQVCDLKSLNGTFINGNSLKGDWELTSGDEFQVGQLAIYLSISWKTCPISRRRTKKTTASRSRSGSHAFLTPVPDEPPPEGATHAGDEKPRHSLSRDLSLLYRLALDMGAARAYEEPIHALVLDLSGSD